MGKSLEEFALWVHAKYFGIKKSKLSRVAAFTVTISGKSEILEKM